MTSRKTLPQPSNKKPRNRLKRWQLRWAQWFHAAPEAPSKADQCAVASRLASEDSETPVSITYNQLRKLKQRADFQRVVTRLEEGGIEAARELFVGDLAHYVELHRWGADRAKEKDDPRGLVTFTLAALDRVMPRNQVLVDQRQTINVKLNEAQLALVEDALQDEPAALPPALAQFGASKALPVPPPPTAPAVTTWIDDKTGRTLQSVDGSLEAFPGEGF